MYSLYYIKQNLTARRLGSEVRKVQLVIPLPL
jgi:hypothetical protein